MWALCEGNCYASKHGESLKHKLLEKKKKKPDRCPGVRMAYRRGVFLGFAGEREVGECGSRWLQLSSRPLHMFLYVFRYRDT